jgi:hypothetical protein
VNVTVEIFTIAFRKVKEETFPQVLGGTDLPITMTDKDNNQLANGLYYVRVSTSNRDQSIVKLLLLR